MNRVNSNTPLQALDLLNDPIYVEAARVFAQNILERAAAFDRRSTGPSSSALSRKPGEGTRRCWSELYQESLAEFRADPKAARRVYSCWREAPVDAALKPADLAAMTTVASAILNLHETITRN